MPNKMLLKMIRMFVADALGMSVAKSLDMPRNPYRAGERYEGTRFQLPTMPYHPTLTSSSVHLSSLQLTTTFLSYYNVIQMTICAEK